MAALATYTPGCLPILAAARLNEADLAVLESMVMAQEAEVEEMTFAQAQAEAQAQAGARAVSDDHSKETDTSPSFVTPSKAQVPHSPVFTSTKELEATYARERDTGQNLGDLSQRVADVASSMASTLESITAVAEGLEGSHQSSDEGEEQMMIMRDSPRWEDEEIQADDTDEPRAIKAEIKLLVKTTEVGKESIEIRSIREFVENENPSLTGFTESVQPPGPEVGRLTPSGEGVYMLHRPTSDLRAPSPRFVRHQTSPAGSAYHEPSQDEFDLMAQVRGKAGFRLLL